MLLSKDMAEMPPLYLVPENKHNILYPKPVPIHAIGAGFPVIREHIALSYREGFIQLRDRVEMRAARQQSS